MKYIDNEIESLIKEHGTRIFTEKQVAKIINKSQATLARWRKQGLYIKYKKNGGAKNAPIEYTARSIAEYIINNDIQIS